MTQTQGLARRRTTPSEVVLMARALIADIEALTQQLVEAILEEDPR